MIVAEVVFIDGFCCGDNPKKEAVVEVAVLFV
jgi:hypothetical protein